jgi:amino acid adenylation domain-containing protein
MLLHQIFEGQALRQPDRVAIEYQGISVTYGQLNASANQLAVYIRNVQQVKSGVVALSLEKGPLLVTAVLAVLKAGLAWVPLPLDSPRSRIQMILDISSAGLVLCSQSTVHNSQGMCNTVVLNASDTMQRIQQQPRDDSSATDTGIGPADLCHILFTSGSTGVPKGVMLEHQAVVHNVQVLKDHFGLDEHTRTLQFAMYTFDIFGLDLFMTFQAGGCLVMGNVTDMMSDLTGFINRARINYAQLTPTIISLISPGEVSTLNVLASSGEPLTAEILHQWADRLRLINAYGPTETIVCTVQDMSVAPAPGPQMIGTALPGLDVVVMREDCQEEAPPGAVGEICVAGVQLCRGYIGVDDGHPGPFFHRGDQRFYRTGDLGIVTHLADSVPSIRLLGRRDAQVKLHGVRIDLGEVDTILRSYPGTLQCAVFVLKAGSAQGKLAAVVSINDTGPWSLVETGVAGMNVLYPTQPSQKVILTDLNNWVRLYLPPQAVPSTWWIVDKFPLTASGKLDRMVIQGWLENISEREIVQFVQSWAIIDQEDARPEAEAVALERQLVGICSKILRLSPAAIDPRVSLLKIGFDSLDIFRMVSMAYREGLDLSVQQVLREYSIRQLSRSLYGSNPRLQPLCKTVYEPFSLANSPGNLQGLKASAAKQCHVDIEDVLDIYPCTPLQIGIMALAARRSDAYICNFTFLVSQDVDIHRFRRAWESLLFATPILRNRIVQGGDGEGFLQATIRRHETFWSDNSFGRPMTFGSDLCRARFIRDEASQRWRFILKIHHALFDGWTRDLILLELQNVYNRKATEENDPSTTASFTKYIQYLIRDVSDNEVGHVSFWRSRLEKCSITEFPRIPTVWTGELAAAYKVLTCVINADVSDIMRKYQITATTVVQAAWAIVLGKHTATDDVVFGSTLSGRNAPVEEIDSIIGPTMVTVPCRIRWSSTVTVVQFLRKLHQESVDLIPYQHYGLQNIGAIGQDEKNACLFRTLLVVQPENATIEKTFMEGDEQLDSDMLRTYPITIEYMLSGSPCAKVKIHYDENLISTEMATWVLRHLECALCSIGSADSGTLVSDLQILGDDERDIMEASQRVCPQKINRCLHALVEETAKKYPEHVAILQHSPPRILTYQRLDQSSTSLARYLQHIHEIGPGDIVPVGFEKSALAIVAMLAVLKAGAAYVAFDAAQPARHIQRIMTPLKPKYALCSKRTYPRVQKIIENVVQISDDWLSETGPPVGALPQLKHHASASDNAVLFFTSGSTGQPKCIASRHSAISTSMYHCAQFFRIQPGARVFQSTSFTFDMSLKDIYCTLLSGGCLCLPSDEDRLSAEHMRQMGISVAFLTPSVAEAIVPEDVPSLRILNLGGEKTTAALISRWARKVRLVISYGPTETIACVTTADAVEEDADPDDIGQPVTGQVWIVQRNSMGSLVPASIGCVGEIAISGHTVAQGYYEDAARTAECFVKQPRWMQRTSADSDAYLYLTGDLGSKEQNGRIRIVGRKDAQIKINGIRIEPAEAEHELRQLGGNFTSAVVDAARRPHMTKLGYSQMVLVAFVHIQTLYATEQERRPTFPQSLIIPPDAVPDEFKLECRTAQKKLAQKVPQHLIPGVFIPVWTIPMTVSGKTDRKRLRAALENEAYGNQYMAVKPTPTIARNPLQQLASNDKQQQHICRIWQETLGTKRNFTASDNFFRVGGDSLMAIRLVLACRHQGLQITVAQIYQNPTIEQMAAMVVRSHEHPSRHRSESPLPFSLLPQHARQGILAEAAQICNIDIQQIEDVYPASPFQEGLAAVNLHSKSAYMAMWVYSMPIEVNTEQVEHALEIVVAQNPIFRTALAHTSEGTMQIVIKMTEWKNQRSVQNQAAEQLQVEGNTRLFRYKLRVGQSDETKAYLQFDVHHILYDEWTMQYFLDDLAYNYCHLNAPRPGRLSYVNFIRQLERLRQNDEASMAFWKSELEGAEELEFPPSPSSGRLFKTNSAIRSSDLISLDYRSSKAEERPAVTPAAITAAALAIVLSSYSHTEDIIFGLTLSGRHVSGLEEVAGPTTSTVPLRIQVSGGQTIPTILSDVQSKMRNIQEFQHVGLHKIAKLNTKGAKKACAFRTLLVVQQNAGSESTLANQAPQLTMVEEETFISLNYGLVIVLMIDRLMGHSKFRAEFDSDSITEQQAQDVLSRLVQITTQLSSMEGTIDSLLQINRQGDVKSVQASQLYPDLVTAGSRVADHSGQHESLTVHQIELRKLWAGVMSISPASISLNDDIHSLGGDSITLIRLLSAARKVGISLGIGDTINQFTTLEEMASTITISRGTQDAKAVCEWLPEPFSLMAGVPKDTCIKDASSKCGVDPKSVMDVYPCTPLQDGLMALSSTEPGAYFVQHCYKVVGNVDQDKLECALRRVWQTKAILRTRIIINSKLDTVQVVLDDRSLPFGVYRHYSTLQEYLARDRRVPFEYGRPLTRFALVIDGRRQAYLVLSQHHAVSDGWTTRLLEDAIKTEYARSSELHQNLVANPIPAFIRFVKSVQGSVDATQFWKTTLSGACITRFPPSGKDGTFRTNEMIVSSCAIPSSCRIALSILLEAAWGLVLSRCANSNDICFGVVRSGRMAPVPEIETIMAPSIATAPRRLKLHDKLQVSQYLDEVASLGNKTVPFEQYGLPNIRLLGADAKDACDFRTLLVVQPTQQVLEEVAVGQLVLEPVDDEGPMTENYGITIDCQPHANGMLIIHMNYDNTVISASEITRISEHFVREISRLGGKPDGLTNNINIFDEHVPELDTCLTSQESRVQDVIPLSVDGKPGTTRDGLSNGCAIRNGALDSVAHAAEQKPNPENSLQDILRRLWADVLHIDLDTIDLDGDFLMLGGDSISAIKLSSHAREHGISLPAKSILQNPLLKNMTLHMGEQQAFKLQAKDHGSTWNDKQRYQLQISETYGIAARDIDDIYPCTPLQISLMALTLRQQNAYVATETFRLSPSTDIERFTKAWDLVYQRHELLRTRLCQVFDDNGHATLVQVVCASDIVPWYNVTTDLPPEQQQRGHLFTEMDLGTPLSRLVLVKNTGRDIYFQLTRHHSIYDGWSTRLLWDDFKYAYLNGQSPQSRPHFRSYVHYLQSLDRNMILEFWKKELDGFRADHYPALPYGSPATDGVSSTAELTIKTDNGHEHITKMIGFPHIARAAWALVLASVSRWPSQTHDICFGAVVSGRMEPVAAIEDIAGPTLSTVPVRVKIDMNESVGRYLKRVRDNTMATTSFEHIGLNSISQISEEARAACQFRNILVVQSPEDLSNSSTNGLDGICEVVSSGVMSQPYGVVVECTQHTDGSGFRLGATFDTALLPESEMRMVLRNFSRIVTLLGDSSQSGTSVADLLRNLASIEDYEQMLSYNGSAAPASTFCLHKLFERSAQSDPHRSAVLAHDQELTYKALGEAAGRLALHLRQELGVGTNMFVPICFEKSSFMVIAMLAIMKAGGAYVPLDTSHPPARLQDMIVQCKPKLILTSTTQRLRISEVTTVQTLVVDASLLELCETNLPMSVAVLPTVSPQDLAYMIFTSGSTGQPKGVLMEHGSVALSMMNYANVFEYTREREFKVLQFSSYTFDVSVAEIFATLAFGGTVCVPKEEDRLNNLADVITSMGINMAFLTPTMASILEPGDVPTLEVLCLTGESSTPSLIQNWTRSPHTSLFNAYGPTEAAVHCAAGKIHQSTGPNNIGSPFGGQLWIVDSEYHTKLKPVGCIGELVISGSTLARGYLGDAKLTARAFVENVSWFEGVQPRRLYMTGDMARYMGDGTIEFLGRKDGRQVKFHGLRIELGEIEAALQSCDRDGALANVAVEKLPIAARDTLVAFVQIKGSSVPNSEVKHALIPCHHIDNGVKSFIKGSFASLQHLLPRYMIPSLFLPVLKWPYSTSGKTNRELLRKLSADLSDTTVDMYRAITEDGIDSHGQGLDCDNGYHDNHRTTQGNKSLRVDSYHNTPLSPSHVQELVTGLWRRALRRGTDFRPGLDQDFFRVGGDSVSVIFLVAEFRRKGIDTTVRDIYDLETLSAMVNLVLSQQGPSEDNIQSLARGDTNSMIKPFSLVQTEGATLPDVMSEVAADLSIGPDSIQDMYPCTPLQEGIMFLSERVKGSYHAHLSLLMPRQLDLDRLYNAFRKLVEMHEILRTRIIFHKTLGSIQVVLTAVAHFGEVEKLNSQSKDGSVNFGYGLPLHRHGLTARNNRIYLELDFHHSIYDGWSLPLLIDDLRCLYRDTRYSPETPPRPFRDVATHINDPSIVQAGDHFWGTYLQGAVMSDFPELTGRTHDSIRATSYYEHSISLDPLQYSQDTSLATVLIAAWSLVVSCYTSSDDVCFGLLLSGRNAPIPGIEGIRGPTINTVPFRVALDHQNATIAVLLNSVQAHTLDMIPHQFTSLSKLRKVFSDGHGDFGSLLSIQTGTDAIQDDGDSNGYDPDFSTYALPADGKVAPAIFGEPYPLFLGITADRARDKVAIGAQYDPSIVSADQLSRILSQYEVAFHALADVKLRNTYLADVSLLSDRDKQCLSDWAGPRVESGDSCVHEIIEKIAAEHPHHQALEGFTESLTYAQLDQQANSLASHLLHITKGRIRRDTTIPVWMEVSPTAIVAILAVLKLGASYVPLDQRFPVARAEYIVGDVAADIILVSEAKFGSAAELAASLGTQKQDLMVVQVGQAIKTMKMLNGPRSHVIPSYLAAKTSDLAYVIYTSGSTGKPKGVMMEHWALTATVKEQAITYGFDANTRMFGLASLSWDPSLLEIFAILSHGGCLCIPTEDERSGCQDLVDSINRHRANQISTSPAVASLIDLRSTPTVKAISVGGEVIREENILNAHEAGVHLFNIYGPSEACIDAIVHRNVVPGVSPQNIGKPMSSQVWIVDPRDPRRLVPPGCAGELALSGPLARGYLNDELKTARSFLTDCPFASPVYLTGDLGRYEVDGSIYFLGRKDRQVKLNGQRVELGDIENAIKTLYIQHDAVVDYSAAPGESKKMLVVYLSTSSSNSTSSSPSRRESRKPRPVRVESRMRPDSSEFQRLQMQLKGLLPRYMVPRIFLTVSRLPLSNADKIDFKSLRAAYAEWMQEATSEVSSTHQTNTVPEGSAPHALTLPLLSPNEIVLRGFWASAIGSAEESIQKHDDIFDRGADSLTVIKLAMLARTEGYNLSVAQIYASPTLSTMAQCLQSDSYQNPASAHNDETIEPFSLLPASIRTALGNAVTRDAVCSSDVVDMFPCTSFQATAILQGQKKHKAFYAWFLVRIKGRVDLERLRAACNLLVQRHAALRTSYRVIDGHFLQQIHAHAQTLTNFEILESCESEETFVALLDRHDPDPVSFEHILTRFRVSAYSGDEDGGYILGMGMSHAQYDGFCWTAILDDLHQAYLSQTLGHGTGQPPASFSRFISHSIKASLDPKTTLFWSELLEGATMTSFTSRTEQPRSLLVLDSRQLRILPRYNSRLGNATFAVVVKAAWSIVLSWLAASTDVVFGSLVFGRNPEIDGVGEMVGACINVVPNRVSFLETGDFTIANLLEEIQQQQVSIVPYESTALPKICQCMSWPSRTRFGSIVQHQNIEEEVFLATMSDDTGNGDSSTSWSFAGSAVYPGLCDDVVDCWITTIPRPQEIQLHFQYNATRIPHDCASRIVQLFCDVIHSIYADTSRPLNSIKPPQDTLSSIRMQIPQADCDDDKLAIEEAQKGRIQELNEPTRHVDNTTSLLRELWVKVLPERLFAGREDDDDASFFGLGGNSALAVQLAIACQQRGLMLTVQEICLYPTKRLQAGYLRGEYGNEDTRNVAHLVLEPK